MNKHEIPDMAKFVDSESLRKKLGEEAWNVVACGGTEPPFRNAYWDNHEDGLYVDVVDGTPLFASGTKFDSGTGWPSFFAPVSDSVLEMVEDQSFGMRRVEVKSRSSGAHLGHVFPDGPAPTRLRYCINSHSLRFIPRSELAANGLETWETAF